MKKIIIFLVTSLILLGCTNQNNPTTNMRDDTHMNNQYITVEQNAYRDGYQIYGILYLPKIENEKMPAVIYSHGFAGSHEYGEQYARELAKKGYVVYCFDFCGGSPQSQSDGSSLDMSIFTEQQDLEAVLKMVQDLEFVDESSIYLLGTSQGGVVSALTAAANPDAIKGLILLYPAFVLVDNANELFDDVDDIPDTYYHLWMRVERTYFENLIDYDVYSEISSYGKNVLILHGDADSIVPLSYSQKALEVYPSSNLYVIEGAGHGFYNEEFDEAMKYINDYLQENR